MDDKTDRSDMGSMDVLLDRLDALPSPTAVAMRLMTMLESDSVTTREVVDLISTDPALSARVVGLCSRSPRGRALGITSVERAVSTSTTLALGVGIATPPLPSGRPRHCCPTGAVPPEALRLRGTAGTILPGRLSPPEGGRRARL